MEEPDFEEKQFEWALGHELTAGSPTAYPSGQVFEALTGYDLALRAGNRDIWDLLEVGMPPGAILSSGLWSGAPKKPPDSKLPRSLVSLVLQVKRPQRLDHWRAGQYEYWQGRYYRFYIGQAQQAQLVALEQNLKEAALVRYVGPAFLTFSDLYMHQHGRTLAAHSTFVAPHVLRGHRLWSYRGPGTIGYANPGGEVGESDEWGTLIERAAAMATRVSLEDHILELAARIEPDEDPNRWPIGTFEDFGLSKRQSEVARAWALTAQMIAFSGAEWFVLELDR